MNVNIDQETIEQIVRTQLKNCIDYTKNNIESLNYNSVREKYQDEDLCNHQELLPHLEAVYEYFGGNLNHKDL